MAWFLKRKSKRSTKRKTSRGTAAQWDPQRTLLGVKILTLAGCVVGGALLWHYGGAALRQRAARAHAREVQASDVVLANAPGWMSPTVQQGLRELVEEQVHDQPLNGVDLERAMAVLNGNAWVKQVQRIRRDPDGRVSVWASYRQPVAMVVSPGAWRLVDRDGVMLPGLYEERPSALEQVGLPVITGVALDPPKFGEVWPGHDVQAGLALVRQLAGEPYADQIRAYDVSRRDSRGRLRLVLHSQNGRAIWGLPPGDEGVFEPTPAVKRERLRRVVEQRGSIDAGGHVVELYGPATQVQRAELFQASSR